VKRREFIAGLGGAVAWPLAARAQQGERVRRVGMLIPFAENDRFASSVIGPFHEELGKLGWVEGLNLITAVRFGEQDADRIRVAAAELVSLMPDVIFTVGGASTRTMSGRRKLFRSSWPESAILSATAS